MAIAWVLPFTPLAALLGFVAPPPAFMLAIAGPVAIYLACAEAAKRRFYRARRRRPSAQHRA